MFLRGFDTSLAEHIGRNLRKGHRSALQCGMSKIRQAMQPARDVAGLIRAGHFYADALRCFVASVPQDSSERPSWA